MSDVVFIRDPEPGYIEEITDHMALYVDVQLGVGM